MNCKQLKSRLRAAGINTDLYGVGDAKTIKNLCEEVASGETSLQVIEGTLVRALSVVSINVSCHKDGTTLRLIEDRQVFPDGRVRERDYLYGAVSEKMLPGEAVETAIRRALAEEIQVEKFTLTYCAGPEMNRKFSPSYPGLKTHYCNYEANVEIDPSEYRDTYKEVQADKTTYFIWVPAN